MGMVEKAKVSANKIAAVAKNIPELMEKQSK